MDGKKWWQSKTMLLNLGAILLGTAEQVAGTGLLGPSGDTVLQVTGIANMLLRAITTQPIR